MTTIDADIVSRLRCVREDLDTAQELLEIGPSYRRAARAYALAALGLLDSTLELIVAKSGTRAADVAPQRESAATDRNGEGSPQGQDAPDGSTPSDGPRTGRERRQGMPLLLTGPGGAFLQANDTGDLLD
jgi:hypothetical protein